MRTFHSQLPALLIPVYYGKSLFKRCLDSVKSSEDLFSSIIISINGTEPSQDIATVEAAGLKTKNLNVYVTHSELNSIKHGKFISDKLSRAYDRHQWIFLLCHDDEIIHKGLVDLIKAFRKNTRCIYLGDYQVKSQDETIKLVQSLPDSCNNTPLNRIGWLKYTTRNSSIFTNVSGFLMPLVVYHDYTSFLFYSRSSRGCRTEFLILSHPHFSFVSRLETPFVKINQHANQEGRIKVEREVYRDGIRYLIWLLLSSRSISEIIFLTFNKESPVLNSILNRLRKF